MRGIAWGSVAFDETVTEGFLGDKVHYYEMPGLKPWRPSVGDHRPVLDGEDGRARRSWGKDGRDDAGYVLQSLLRRQESPATGRADCCVRIAERDVLPNVRRRGPPCRPCGRPYLAKGICRTLAHGPRRDNEEGRPDSLRRRGAFVVRRHREAGERARVPVLVPQAAELGRDRSAHKGHI